MERRFWTCAFLALIILSMFVSLPGCMQNEDQPAETTTQPAASDETSKSPDEGYDENGYILDNLPDDLNFQNAEVTFLIWEDCPMLEFFVEGLNGEIINDAIFERNRIVEDRLGVKLNYVATLGNDTHMAAYMQKAEADLTSGAPANMTFMPDTAAQPLPWCSRGIARSSRGWITSIMICPGGPTHCLSSAWLTTGCTSARATFPPTCSG